MKIAICDDDQRDIERLRQRILAHSSDHQIIEFLSTEPFLKCIYAGECFDLLFLDVQMPDSDGWEVAKELKRSKHRIYIAMVTVFGEYIYDCFDRVDWFAQKPVSQERVNKILESAREHLYPIVLEFETDKGPVALTAPEVIYLEVIRNTLFIHTTHDCYKVRMPLKKARDILKDCPQFVQTHNSYIINLEHYSKIKGTSIFLKNHEEIKLTRTYRTVFYNALSEYIRRL